MGLKKHRKQVVCSPFVRHDDRVGTDVLENERQKILFVSLFHMKKRTFPFDFFLSFLREHRLDLLRVKIRQGVVLQVDVLTRLGGEGDDVVHIADDSIVVSVEVRVQDILNEHLELVHGHLLHVPLRLHLI